MATILRDWSYRYQWLYDGLSRLAALVVGGEAQFRQLALRGVAAKPGMQILDLCCGSGQATRYLVDRFAKPFSSAQTAEQAEPNSIDPVGIVGLDASPRSIQRAQRSVPEATYVQGWAEAMPFADQQFDLVHTSVALHEMKPDQLRLILEEIYRVLKPDGIFTFVDFHQPSNLLFVPGLYLFLILFETETSWQLLRTDLKALLEQVGFQVGDRTLHAGGSLQVVQAHKLHSP